jgi:hypothetical protein
MTIVAYLLGRLWVNRLGGETIMPGSLVESLSDNAEMVCLSARLSLEDSNVSDMR